MPPRPGLYDRLAGSPLPRLGQEPQVRFVIMTGYLPEDRGDPQPHQGLAAWIAKPFSLEELAGTIRTALAG